jgi:hypothetical protein
LGRPLETLFGLSQLYGHGSWLVCEVALRAALHLEARPIPREADYMKFQPLLGWRLALTSNYNKLIMGANFPMCKSLRAKKPSRFNKYSIIQRT